MIREAFNKINKQKICAEVAGVKQMKMEAAETLSAFAYQILWLLLETAIAIDHLCLPKFDRNFKN